MNDTAFLEERIGMTLKGKWTLERLLGCGGMAAVYLGVHSIGKRHAIKILHPEVAASPEVRARFEQEAHAVSLLHHPGAVEIHDYDIAEDGCPFLVMELLEGETLGQRLNREKQYDLRELLAIADQTLEVLAAAHTEGIVHRDIKPANLFLVDDGNVKVLDFGVARMLEGAKVVHTNLGTALGTPTYMPPEQARGEAIDGRADLFAMGGTLFRAITRQRIHRCESQADMLIKMATTPAPSLASVAPHVSEDVCLVVDRALAFQRDQRYPHARVMQVDVRALLEGKTPPYASKRALDDPLPMPLVNPSPRASVPSVSNLGSPPVSGGPALGSPPVSGGPALGSPPVSGGPALGSPPVSGGPALGSPPVSGGPALGSPPVSGGPVPASAATLPSAKRSDPPYPQPSEPPSGRVSGAEDPTSAETPAARVPSWPVPKTLTDVASAPPPPAATAPMAPMMPLGPLAPIEPKAPKAPLPPVPPLVATVPMVPYPQGRSSKGTLLWIAILVLGVLVLLVGGTLGGLYLCRSNGPLEQMEAK
jgi:eukaryotic-like serine/threonine-protein kinase